MKTYQEIMDDRHKVLNAMANAEDARDWDKADRLREKSYVLLNEAMKQKTKFTAKDAYGSMV